MPEAGQAMLLFDGTAQPIPLYVYAVIAGRGAASFDRLRTSGVVQILCNLR